MTAPEESAVGLGVQNERTTLAWRRTNLAALGTAALAARASGRIPIALALLLVALVATAGVGWRADVRSRVRADALATMEPPAWPDVASGRGVVAGTALTLGLGLAGLAVVLFS